MKRKCDVEGCAGDHYAKGLCNKHYQRLLRVGDPYVTGRKTVPLEERFKANLAPEDPVTGCVEWVGGRDKKGYGSIRRPGSSGRLVLTHRLAWELKHGPIPEGLDVLHKCDNPPCCNDDHLFLGTNADNVADREAKGRGNQPKGERNGRAKLTEVDVVEIRRRLAAGEFQRVIAADFGITREHVNLINTGKTRKHQLT